MSAVQAAPTYAWITGRSHRVDPQVVGDTIAEIEQREGSCHPGSLVREATPETHPCHELFEWDNDKAGHKYRVDQARRVIRSIRIMRFPVAQTPAFISVRLPEEGATSYVSAERVVNNRSYREFALNDALKQLVGLRNRYSYLHELQSIWRSIDDYKADEV